LSFLGGTSGQTMVEFALVLPLLVLLTISGVEFGLVVKDWINVTNSARVAGRAAAAARFSDGPTCSGVRAAVNTAMTSEGFSPSDASISSSDPNCAPGSRVTVTVSRPWNVSVPFLPFSPSGTITSDVTEKIE
jgi:Flp pilus assembly protein TadG